MENQLIYLDNAASTHMDERVLEAMKPYFFDVYAVASSEFGYSMGIQAREDLDKARGEIAHKLGASTEEFIFTSGGTESSNTAVKGVSLALEKKKGKHIITSKIEDFPVLNSIKALEKQGYKATYIDVDKEGFVDTDQLKDSITEETILVSIQHANQEIGTIQDIGKIEKYVGKRELFFIPTPPTLSPGFPSMSRRLLWI